MRIDTVKTKVYKFEELSDKAKETALGQFRDINTDIDWWESVYEMWTEKLEAMGYYEVDIKFSGFYNQGDGASFTARVDLEKWLKYNHKLTEYKKLSKYIKEYSQIRGGIDRTSSMYVHENTITASVTDDIYEEYSEEVGKLLNKLEEDLDTDSHDLSQEIYSDLKKEYEYLESDECVTEMILANDYEFTEDGKQY